MVSCPHRIAVVSFLTRLVRPGPAVAGALAVCLLALTGCDDDGRADAGAPGVGDPYFPLAGNGGYDVSHYGLTLSYDPGTGRLTGRAVVTARATRDLAAFDLDLAGLDVRDVTVGGRRAGVRRSGQELTVRPAGAVGAGETFETVVRYSGRPRTLTDPDGSQEGWLPTADGALALGEPVGGMAWFPGDHHPSDKAAYDLTVTVPEGLTAVSNGQLTRATTSGGRTTYTWHTAEPMASYLATLAIGRYEVRRSTTGGGVPVYTAVDPEQADDSRAVLARLPEIMDWATYNFGPYPFSSTGAVVERPGDAEYALETQNRPVFPGAPDTGTLVHELAHQWFGDSVTPRTWRDMWLNEGFATYAEWLWDEDHGGDSAQETFDTLYDEGEDGDEHLWDFPPAKPPGAAHVSGRPVYARGAMVVHMIRRTVGDDAFYDLVQGWTAAHRHGTASTADFTAYVERHAPDEDWAPIWKTWLYGKAKPPRP
ncbi:M1 family metallopeptidase [Streptomyces longwoodensis]|uniref:Aminopeptidase N n=1 Tax=Streptomyces lasalocidi TaxID=324833 RepID=A0A4V6AWS6_STRLS|nr:M1 family metallopeptidase [Streptomyces lasalocidi]TKT05033.1 M1 family metallopeptidase [Streptomyces lasalocidi]WUC75918.1 M1 family metallopeptidase [Streptomyces longwoodensis]